MLAVIIKGNPKFIHTDIAQRYYKEIEAFLKKLGFKVEFDAGDDYTRPRQDADLYIGHSRGTSRYEFMTAENKHKFVKLGSHDGIIAADDRAWQKANPPGTKNTPLDSHFTFSKLQQAAIVHKMKVLGLIKIASSHEAREFTNDQHKDRLIHMALKDPFLGPAAVTEDPTQMKWIMWNDRPIGFYVPKQEADGRYRTGTIYIDPAYRGKGHAYMEVKGFFDEGKKPGRAWIEPGNRASQSLYKRAGFYKSGRVTTPKGSHRMFEEWVNQPTPPLTLHRSLGW